MLRYPKVRCEIQVNQSSCGRIILDDVPLEEVSSFKYLGASFKATGQAGGENAAKINPAWGVLTMTAGAAFWVAVV